MRRILALSLFASVACIAQPPPGRGFQPPPGRGFPPPDGRRDGPPPGGDRAEGKWWYNPSTVQRLSLAKDQQRKIEDIFQRNRLKLIDLSASLEREQAVLDSLLAADHPDEPRVLAQFDRVADARTALEKSNARMLWGFRTVLSADQWKELQAEGGVPGPGPGPPPR